MEVNFSETTVDRSDEYDQTKRHETPLPFHNAYYAAAGRTVSPAIREQQVINLTNRLREAEKRALNAEMERNALQTRIDGFERMTKAIAVKCDEMQATIEAIQNTEPKFPSIPRAA